MLSTIYFDNQLCASAVKIHDKSANDPLFVNLRLAFSNWLLSLGMVIVFPPRPRYARPPLPKGEARCFPGYFTPSGTRCARPPLPKGEARDARAVHRKVYRSAPFISSANWSLLLDTVVFECFIFSDKAKAYLFQHMLTPSIFPDGICVYRSFVINIGLKQVHIHIDRRIIRPMLVQFVT